jgi:hypothetical protein
MKTIEDLAREVGLQVEESGGGPLDGAIVATLAELARFAALVRAQALDEAIAAIAPKHLGETSNQEDQAYNDGVNDCEIAIHALKDQPAGWPYT